MIANAEVVFVGEGIAGRVVVYLAPTGAATPPIAKKILDFVGELAESVRLS